MPSLLVYDDGTSVMKFTKKETLLHQKIWSGLRYKNADGMQHVADCIVVLEMHKHRCFGSDTTH